MAGLATEITSTGGRTGALRWTLDIADTALRGLTEGFPTAGLAEFSVPGPWHGLNSGGGRLARFLTPRGLEENG